MNVKVWSDFCVTSSFEQCSFLHAELIQVLEGQWGMGSLKLTLRILGIENGDFLFVAFKIEIASLKKQRPDIVHSFIEQPQVHNY